MKAAQILRSMTNAVRVMSQQFLAKLKEEKNEDVALAYFALNEPPSGDPKRELDTTVLLGNEKAIIYMLGKAIYKNPKIGDIFGQAMLTATMIALDKVKEQIDAESQQEGNASLN